MNPPAARSKLQICFVHPQRRAVILRKFLHLTNKDTTIEELAKEIVQRHAKLYPDDESIEITRLQDSDGCDLDTSYIVSDVFDTSNAVRVVVKTLPSSLAPTGGTESPSEASFIFTQPNAAAAIIGTKRKREGLDLAKPPMSAGFDSSITMDGDMGLGLSRQQVKRLRKGNRQSTPGQFQSNPKQQKPPKSLLPLKPLAASTPAPGVTVSKTPSRTVQSRDQNSPSLTPPAQPQVQQAQAQATPTPAATHAPAPSSKRASAKKPVEVPESVNGDGDITMDDAPAANPTEFQTPSKLVLASSPTKAPRTPHKTPHVGVKVNTPKPALPAELPSAEKAKAAEKEGAKGKGNDVVADLSKPIEPKKVQDVVKKAETPVVKGKQTPAQAKKEAAAKKTDTPAAPAANKKEAAKPAQAAVKKTETPVAKAAPAQASKDAETPAAETKGRRARQLVPRPKQTLETAPVAANDADDEPVLPEPEAAPAASKAEPAPTQTEPQSSQLPTLSQILRRPSVTITPSKEKSAREAVAEPTLTPAPVQEEEPNSPGKGKSAELIAQLAQRRITRSRSQKSGSTPPAESAPAEVPQTPAASARRATRARAKYLVKEAPVTTPARLTRARSKQVAEHGTSRASTSSQPQEDVEMTDAPTQAQVEESQKPKGAPQDEAVAEDESLKPMDVDTQPAVVDNISESGSSAMSSSDDEDDSQSQSAEAAQQFFVQNGGMEPPAEPVVETANATPEKHIVPEVKATPKAVQKTPSANGPASPANSGESSESDSESESDSGSETGSESESEEEEEKKTEIAKEPAVEEKPAAVKPAASQTLTPAVTSSQSEYESAESGSESDSGSKSDSQSESEPDGESEEKDEKASPATSAKVDAPAKVAPPKKASPTPSSSSSEESSTDEESSDEEPASAQTEKPKVPTVATPMPRRVAGKGEDYFSLGGTPALGLTPAAAALRRPEARPSPSSGSFRTLSQLAASFNPNVREPNSGPSRNNSMSLLVKDQKVAKKDESENESESESESESSDDDSSDESGSDSDEEEATKKRKAAEAEKRKKRKSGSRGLLALTADL
ncbi:hypothetical protein G7K_1251-t1 [Saitoella complicata NRRL Y-17804]|uniref:Nucleolar protein Dnt1-like N-terminal domain-containing protein n=2 Tax=Saitoella complicata (strain BCRC 22490 / CBS 7301 / JCM 7358 / NBRC 10748 / NRRL Y-17804) TaxID=698492 RepID=A0A0E9NB57_SAICN|nr:hypothetical protein G7K_1251-t1 [Saitoella complicata NRRL Y-17804]